MEELRAQAAKAAQLEEKNKQLEDILKRIQIQKQSEQEQHSENLNRLEVEKRELLDRIAGMRASGTYVCVCVCVCVCINIYV